MIEKTKLPEEILKNKMKRSKQTKLFKQERIQFLDNALLIRDDGDIINSNNIKKGKARKDNKNKKYKEDNEYKNNEQNENILVFSDFHIGYEEHIVSEGIFPNIQLKEIIKDLKGIFDNLKKQKVKLTKIIILGDLKHEFGGISDTEWRDTLRVLDFLEQHCKDIILIKGNHDTILGPIARKRNIIVKPYYKYKDVLFMHGHKEYKRALAKDYSIILLGHLHPAISLKDKYKKEKYKCFLTGKWKKKQVYVLPSFSNISFGYDLKSLGVNHNHGRGFDFLVDNKHIRKLKVVIYDSKGKKAYDFGKLGGLL